MFRKGNDMKRGIVYAIAGSSALLLGLIVGFVSVKIQYKSDERPISVVSQDTSDMDYQLDDFTNSADSDTYENSSIEDDYDTHEDNYADSKDTTSTSSDSQNEYAEYEYATDHAATEYTDAEYEGQGVYSDCFPGISEYEAAALAEILSSGDLDTMQKYLEEIGYSLSDEELYAIVETIEAKMMEYASGYVYEEAAGFNPDMVTSQGNPMSGFKYAGGYFCYSIDVIDDLSPRLLLDDDGSCTLYTYEPDAYDCVVKYDGWYTYDIDVPEFAEWGDTCYIHLHFPTPNGERTAEAIYEQEMDCLFFETPGYGQMIGDGYDEACFYKFY